MRHVALLSGVLAIAGCAADEARLAKSQASDAKELAAALEGRTAGKPVDCVSTQGLNGPQIIGDTLLYNDVGRIWRTELAACPGLRDDSLLVVEHHGSQMCERDHTRVLVRGSNVPGATCWMGKFTPYTRPKG